jgi:hypothetical protein
VSLLPHALSISVATQGRLGTWGNRNPRSTDMKAQLKQRISANDNSTYERMQACHANGMEVSPSRGQLHLSVPLTVDRTFHSSSQLSS